MQQPRPARPRVTLMKGLIRMFLGLVIALGALDAHARVYNQGELDALLAPIALYPDPLLNNILDAARYPDDVFAAADWSRGNPGLLGTRLADRYRVVKELGRGGFATVYLAHDEKLALKPVVIKVLDNLDIDQWRLRKFRQEMEAILDWMEWGVPYEFRNSLMNALKSSG